MGIWGRVLAILLAILLALVAWLIWMEITQEHRSEPIEASQLPELGTPMAVTQCVNKRVGDIDQMLSEGFISEEQAAKSRQDARSLCIQQN